MKGKKKKINQNSNGGLQSSSGSDISDSTGTVTVAKRRLSDRIKKQYQCGNKINPKTLDMMDSAYDGDEESATAGSSPDKTPPYDKVVSSNDPYALDNIEDVPVARKTKQKCEPKGKKSKAKLMKVSSKTAKKSTQPAAHSTSTPVQDSNSQTHKRRSVICSSPEVTPILPVVSPESQDSVETDITPFNRRSTRKRPHQLATDTPTLPNTQTSLETTLNCSSHDSGIVVSPKPKKRFAVSNTKDATTKPAKSKKHVGHGGKKIQDKRNVSFMNDITENENLCSSFMGENPCKKRKALTLKSNIMSKNSQSPPRDSESYFGFSMVSSPVPSTPPSSRKKTNPRKLISPKQSYRSAKELYPSDSSPENVLEFGSQDTQGSAESLFSDNLFSSGYGDSFEVNKSSIKAYKPSKVKKIKSTKRLSKIDTWASTFNMEIADIEKFELNIE